MHWIYILNCDDDYKYVGETTRLYRRFYEHSIGKGGENTYNLNPSSVECIYKLPILFSFFEYNENVIDSQNNPDNYNIHLLKNFDNSPDDSDCDNCDHLYTENNIAECLMVHNNNNYDKIRGGKYTRFDYDYKCPINIYLKELPLCKCGFPADIKKNNNDDDEYLYFRCAKKNMWETFADDFYDFINNKDEDCNIEINEEPCNFFMKYIKDEQLKLYSNNKFNERQDKYKHLLQTSKNWLYKILIASDETFQSCCCCHKCFNIKRLMKWNNNIILLCYDCFINNNDILSKKYTSTFNLKKRII